MDLGRIEEALLQTLDDGRLSRAERSALARLLAGEVRMAHDRDLVHGRAFDIARRGLRGGGRRMEWLEDVSRLISASNQENLMVLDHPRLASRCLEEFDRLWRRFGGGARR